MTKINREKSNKVAKTIKTLAFASCMFMMMPTLVNAEETTEVVEEATEATTMEDFARNSILTAVITGLGVVTIYGIYSSKKYPLNKNMKPYVDDGLDDSNMNKDGIKYFKIVNR